MENNMNENQPSVGIIQYIVKRMSDDDLLCMVNDYEYLHLNGVHRQNNLVIPVINEIVSHGVLGEDEVITQLEMEVILESFMRLIYSISKEGV